MNSFLNVFSTLNWFLHTNMLTLSPSFAITTILFNPLLTAIVSRSTKFLTTTQSTFVVTLSQTWFAQVLEWQTEVRWMRSISLWSVLSGVNLNGRELEIYQNTKKTSSILYFRESFWPYRKSLHFDESIFTPACSSTWSLKYSWKLWALHSDQPS